MTIVHCSECGRELYRRESEMSHNTSGLYFCNQKEEGAYYRRHGIAKARPQIRGWHRTTTEAPVMALGGGEE